MYVLLTILSILLVVSFLIIYLLHSKNRNLAIQVNMIQEERQTNDHLIDRRDYYKRLCESSRFDKITSSAVARAACSVLTHEQHEEILASFDNKINKSSGGEENHPLDTPTSGLTAMYASSAKDLFEELTLTEKVA